MTQKSEINAKLPAVELSRLNAKDVIWIDVHLYGERRGWLQIAKGGVEWWPGKHKVNVHAGSWGDFAEALEEKLPERKRPPKKSN
ncbi:MAG TPA: hypothetical protein VME18_03075 [Acidobacteriaceae bacterium]|nr:hypothetical protein [Acidobacteriaceae bacterium]